jgi:hypothetical protein
MLICMRTTLNLPDALAEAAKQRAASEGRTLTSLVEEGLRRVLEVERPTRRIVLPSHGSTNDKVLIDILDKEALWAAIDGEHDPS